MNYLFVVEVKVTAPKKSMTLTGHLEIVALRYDFLEIERLAQVFMNVPDDLTCRVHIIYATIAHPDLPIGVKHATPFSYKDLL